MIGTLPDVMQVVKPIAQTDPIPNDTVSVRAGLDASLVKLLNDGLLYVQSTPEGQKALHPRVGHPGTCDVITCRAPPAMGTPQV